MGLFRKKESGIEHPAYKVEDLEIKSKADLEGAKKEAGVTTHQEVLERIEQNKTAWDKETGIIQNIYFHEGTYDRPTGGKPKTPTGTQVCGGWFFEFEGKTFLLGGKGNYDDIDPNKPYTVKTKGNYLGFELVELLD